MDYELLMLIIALTTLIVTAFGVLITFLTYKHKRPKEKKRSRIKKDHNKNNRITRPKATVVFIKIKIN